MIKGKTLIELTDVKTGKVEQYEDENIITNAGQLYINAMASLYSVNDLNNSSYKRFPLYKGAFGGIKLFENAIEENVNNWHLPKQSNNKIIGYASCDTTPGTDAKRGSANLEETVELENGMQLVWDFATSEANGTISCVCLTSGYGGEIGYPTYYDLGPSVQLSGYVIGYDVDNGYIYVSTNQYLTGKLQKYKYNMNNLKLSDKFLEPALVSEVNSQYSGDAISALGVRFLDASTLYYINARGHTATIYYIDAETLSLRETVTLTLPASIYYSGGLHNGIVLDGYAYFTKDTKDTIYKVNLSNTSDITEFIMEGAELFCMFHKLHNGDIISGNVVFSPETGDYQCGITKSLGMSVYNYIEDSNFIIASYGNGSPKMYAIPNSLMLHSINNLDTPVTKTADKTMKITYTLTYTQ